MFLDARSGIMKDQLENVKTLLKELISRTKDFENLNAFRLFILQHHARNNDLDQAIKLIKQGKYLPTYLPNGLTSNPPTGARRCPSFGTVVGVWRARTEERGKNEIALRYLPPRNNPFQLPCRPTQVVRSSIIHAHTHKQTHTYVYVHKQIYIHTCSIYLSLPCAHPSLWYIRGGYGIGVTDACNNIRWGQNQQRRDS